MARRPAQRKKPSELVAARPCVIKECRLEGSEYRMSAWFCPKHAQRGDPHCTHSLGSPFCAWCGSSTIDGGSE
jgi:hypothetical protein